MCADRLDMDQCPIKNTAFLNLEEANRYKIDYTGI